MVSGFLKKKILFEVYLEVWKFTILAFVSSLFLIFDNFEIGPGLIPEGKLPFEVFLGVRMSSFKHLYRILNFFINIEIWDFGSFRAT